jgi:ABC-type transport system involved in multi-copper enzyme maturation permease subunit
MLKTIMIKELQNHMYSLRFLFGLILTLFLFGISTVSFILDFGEKKSTYEQGMEKTTENRKNAAGNASRFAQNTNIYLFAPRGSAFMASSQEESMPNAILYTAFNVYGYDISKGNGNPFVLPSRNVNWEFILTMLFSFLAIIFTFDAISGEKEMRTLALGLSNPMSRGVLLTGKFLGSVIILYSLIILGVIISLVILLLSGQVEISAITLLEIAGFLLLSFLLIACTTAIGLLASVVSFNPNTSLLIGLMIWLVLMFVVPHTTLLLSNKLFPVETTELINNNTNSSRKVIEASFGEGKWSSDSDDPFIPQHQIRASMQMAFMLGEKKIRDNWYDSQFSQYLETCKLTMISPMFVFEMGDEYLLNGGFQRFRKNWNDLHTYQQQFLSWFKTFDAKDPKSPHWYNPFEDYSTSKAKLQLDEVPVYTEKIVPFGNRFIQVGTFLSLLLVYTSIVFFLSFVLLIRYDVR